MGCWCFDIIGTFNVTRLEEEEEERKEMLIEMKLLNRDSTAMSS